MLEEKKRLIFKFRKYYDILFTIAAFISALYLKQLIHGLPFMDAFTREHGILLLLIIILWFTVLDMAGLYMPYRQKSLYEIIFEMTKAVSIAFMLLIVCLYVFKIEGISRIMMGSFLLIDILFLGCYKWGLYLLIKRDRKSDMNALVVCIVGSKDRARTLIDLIHSNPESHVRIFGCLETDPSLVGTTINYGHKVFNTIDNIASVLTAHVIDELVFAMPLEEIEYADKYIAIAEDIGVSVRIIPDWPLHYFTYHSQVVTIGFEEFMGIPSMHLSTTSPYYGKLLVKSMIDYTVSGIALVLMAPLFFFIALAIRVRSKGPVFLVNCVTA